MRNRTLAAVSGVVCCSLLNISALAQTGAGDPQDMPEPQKIYSPYVERTAADSNFAEGVYCGDTHLHTSYSTEIGRAHV